MFRLLFFFFEEDGREVRSRKGTELVESVLAFCRSFFFFTVFDESAEEGGVMEEVGVGVPTTDKGKDGNGTCVGLMVRWWRSAGFSACVT